MGHPAPAFPGGLDGKESACNAGDLGSITGLGRSPGEGNGNSLQYSCLENPMNRMKEQKDRTLKDEHPRSVGAQYATGEQRRNNSRKTEEMEPKQKQHPAVDMTGGGSKVRYCKEQYCIGTWNVRSTNQGKLEAVKQEMSRVNGNILGIRELKWTGMGEFNSHDHYIYWMEVHDIVQETGIKTIPKKKKCKKLNGCLRRLYK